MDHATTAPAAPGTAWGDPNDAIAFGRRQIQTATRRFFRQASQPKWLKLSASLYPDGKWHLHSSQIGGFASGKLRDPAPKALMVLGQLNLSLAASLTGPDDRPLFPHIHAPKLPGELRKIWAHLTPMLDTTGRPLGPLEVFRAITGDLDLGLDTTREIPADAEPLVSKALARHLRLAFGRLGIDFLEDMTTLRITCASMEPLLLGKTIDGDLLLTDLPALATAINETEGDLWAVCQDALATPSPT